MTNPLTDLIASQGWVLADGATGTNLFNMGLESGEPPELWNVDQPEKIKTLYRGAVAAGSDLFLTNSFGGNAARLKLHNEQARARELSRISAELAWEVANEFDRRVIVAGSVGPTGEIFAPLGEMTADDALNIFADQMEGLKEGGVDLVWIETMSAPEEYVAAAKAAEQVGIDWAGTMSFDTAGRSMMGVTSSQLAELAAAQVPAPLAYGANCGVGASDLLRTVLGFTETDSQIPVIAKGNAGIPKFVHGHIHYDGTPELMADYAILARNCGASVIGGCCGTAPEHLQQMRRALESIPKSNKPSLSDIVEKLGPFSSDHDGTGDTQPPVRVRRRTRSSA